MRIIMAVLALGVTAFPLAARAQEARPPGRNPAELRLLIEERFATVVQEQLGLTEDQATRLRAVLVPIAARRRELETRERELRMLLNRQLRPGIAADPDSVARLVDAITEQRVAHAQSFRDEMKELSGVLTPIQRGQYFLIRERVLQRVRDIRQQRQVPGARVPRG